jgi:hypothetical protein
MQIKRSLAVGLPPSGLADGQLAVELAQTPPRLWCGVPAAIDATERVQLNLWPTQAQLGGPFLLASAGPFLPLTGPAATRTGPLTINSTGFGDNLTLTTSGGTAGMTFGSFASGAMVEWIGGTSMTFTVLPSFTAALALNTSGIVIGSPTGPAVTGAGNINMQGDLFKNGVNLTANAPFLPLAGGTLSGPGNLTTSGFVSIGNPATDPTASVRLTPGSDMLSMPALFVSDGPGLNQMGRWGWNGIVVGQPTGAPVFSPGSVNAEGGYFINGTSIGTPPFLPLAGGMLTPQIIAAPQPGTIWYDGTNLLFRTATTTVTLA